MAASYQLPPLILHPFTDATTSVEILQTAKEAAQSILAGENPHSASHELRTRLMAGRYAEFRMLLFVGKDLFRWMSQCVDFAQRTEGLKTGEFVEQSFAEFLINQTPLEVQTKLRQWGVADYARIFARAIGIYAQFQEPPTQHVLSPDYLKNYYRFADYAYACWKDAVKFPKLSPSEFIFVLYASGEYSNFLEEQWQS